MQARQYLQLLINLKQAFSQTEKKYPVERIPPITTPTLKHQRTMNTNLRDSMRLRMVLMLKTKINHLHRTGPWIRWKYKVITLWESKLKMLQYQAVICLQILFRYIQIVKKITSLKTKMQSKIKLWIKKSNTLKAL